MLKKITLSLFFITHALLCNPDIEKEYPELKAFFASKEFKNLSDTFSIEVMKDGKELIGETRFEIRSDGKIKRTIVLSDTMINRNMLSPEELKFIICHELGHVNDPSLLTGRIVPSAIWNLAAGITLGYSTAGLFYRCPDMLLKTCKVLPSLFVVLAAVRYAARQSEYFADEYSLKMTGNLEAAVAVLKKRQIMKRLMSHSQEGAVNPLREILTALFADHPTEEDRIERLKNLIE
jgi:Zn-dependent protease with chaperone function